MYNFNITITTFRHRFELFKGLVESIRKYNNESNIIIEVNGNTNSPFDETYREQLYTFLSKQNKTFLKVWPEFRALAKQWNDGIISSTTEYVLILSDDIVIKNETFFEDVTTGIERYKGLFTINRKQYEGCPNFGVMVVNQDEMHELGYFDERLLGLGKEDADMTMRYRARYNGKEIPIHYSENFEHFASDIVGDGFQKGNARHPLINMIIFDEKLKRGLEDYQQYPYEKFYRSNKYQIVNFTGLTY
jgi:hypothetical protein